MHTSKCKPKQHPLFVCSLCSAIKFFIGLLIPFLLVLESWSGFILQQNLCVTEMEQEQTPKQFHPKDTETIQTEEHDAKWEFNSACRGMDATVHDIDSTRQSVGLAISSNVDDQQTSLGSFAHGAHIDDGANQERQPIFQSYESYQPIGKQELDSIGDPYALLLAGLEERELFFSR